MKVEKLAGNLLLELPMLDMKIIFFYEFLPGIIIY